MSGDSLLDVMEQIDASYIEEAEGIPEAVPERKSENPGTVPGQKDENPGTVPGWKDKTPDPVPGRKDENPGTVPGWKDKTPDPVPGQKKEVFFMKKKIVPAVIGVAACLAILLAAAFIADQAGWISIGGSRQKTVIDSQDAYWFASAEEMVEQAGLIVSGKVVDISQITTEDDLPYTIYEVEIDQVYKGAVDGDTVQVRIFGGESDQYSVQSVLELSEGGSYLFCAETYETALPCILNDLQAVFDLTTGEVPTTVDLDPGFTLEDVMGALEALDE